LVLRKSFAFSFATCATASVAAALGFHRCPDGFVAGGKPIGTVAFVQAHVSTVAGRVCGLIDDLAALPLSAQGSFALQRPSLAVRMAHLPCTVPCGQLAVRAARPSADTDIVTSAREPGAAAERRLRETHRKLDTFGAAQGYDFAPLIVGTYGRLGARRWRRSTPSQTWWPRAAQCLR
jgi:hypothetical protein